MTHARALILAAAMVACAAAYSEETNMDAVMTRSLVSMGKHRTDRSRAGESAAR